MVKSTLKSRVPGNTSLPSAHACNPAATAVTGRTTASAGSGAGETARPAAKAPVYGRTVLENGVRVITEAMPGVSSVSIGVLVDCGTKDEMPGQDGMAHLTEHLIFQGTCVRDTLQIARHIESFGHAGGFTTRDYTCYYAVTVDDFQFHALDLLGDVLLNSTFPEHGLARERQAILSEMDRCWDMPSQHVHDLARQHALGGQPLGRPIVGSADSITQHTREDVIYFLQQHYTPDRIIIAAAGHLDHADFTAQTRDAFWRLIGKREATPVSAPVFNSGVTVECTNTAQAYFCLLVPAPAYTSDRRYAIHLLNWILGGGISSRLRRTLRDEHGLVYEIGSEYHAYRDGGLISVEGSTSPEYLEEVVSRTLATVSGLLTGSEPVTADELWRAKTHLHIQHCISSEDAYTRMCRLITQEFYFGRLLEAGTVLDDIAATSFDDLNAAIKNELFPELEHSHLVVAGPVRDRRAVSASLGLVMDQVWKGRRG